MIEEARHSVAIACFVERHRFNPPFHAKPRFLYCHHNLEAISCHHPERLQMKKKVFQRLSNTILAKCHHPGPLATKSKKNPPSPTPRFEPTTCNSLHTKNKKPTRYLADTPFSLHLVFQRWGYCYSQRTYSMKLLDLLWGKWPRTSLSGLLCNQDWRLHKNYAYAIT